jgi:hypothetical protein
VVGIYIAGFKILRITFAGAGGSTGEITKEGREGGREGGNWICN